MSQSRVELLAANVDLHSELSLNHGTDTRLRIHTDGKVGVGTATPSTLFTVKNTTPSSVGGILVQNVSYGNNQDYPFLIAATNNWTGAATSWDTYGFQFKFKSDSSGVSRIAIESSVGGSVFEGVSIEDNGFVGLNVTNPTERLDIDGNIKITGTVDGRDVSVDGAKLDGIAAGAEVNVATNLSYAAATRVISSSTGTDATLPLVAPTGNPGLMVATDKAKLDGIAAGAEVNVQSDWNATSGDAFILNKPTIPTNNNQLINGAGYITSADGGDAATLDGIDSSSFLRSDQEDLAAAINIGGEISPTSSAKLQVYGFSRMGPIMLATGTTAATSFNTTNERWIMNDGSHLYASTSSTGYNNKIWTDGNHGPSSGLNADKLDNQEGSYYLDYNNFTNVPAGSGNADTLDNLDSTQFLRSDTSDFMYGELNITHDNGITGSSAPSYANAQLEVQTTTNNVPAISFHRGGYSATALYEYDGQLYTNAWTTRAQTGLLLSTGNIGSYAWTSTNDGSGSGLDADLLDGQQGSYYAPISAPDFSGEVYTSVSQNAWAFRATTGTTTNSSGLWYSGTVARLLLRDSSDTIRTMLAANGTNSQNVINGNTIWHAGNDGSGTGLDADTVDGLQASSFLRSDADDNTTGKLVIGGNYSNNAYNSVSSTRLLFGGGNDPDNYFIGTNLENYGGNYTKLDLRWHTGIRMGAQSGYGGVRIFNNEDLTTLLFSVGRSDGNTRVESGSLYIVGNTAWHAGNDGSGSGLDADNLDGYTWASSGKNVRATEFYADNWFRNYNANEGLYNETTGLHWYSQNTSSMSLYAGSDSTVAMRMMTTGGSIRGYVYANNSNQIGFLNSSGSWSLKCDNSGNVTATGNVTAYSDARLKSDIEPITNALDKVSQINGVTFTRIDSGERHAGVIAQEVEKVLPEVVRDGEDYKSVAYGNMVGLLVEAIKEQQATIQKLTERIEVLEGGN